MRAWELGVSPRSARRCRSEDRRSHGMSLPKLAVTRPVTTAMVLLSLLVLGGISFTRIPLAFLPDVDFPGVFVTVPYPNASPRQIEREIVQPLEEALATIPGARRIRSNATADSADLQLEFTWGETVDVARAKVFEAVEDARGDLPSDVREIYVNTFSTTQIPIVEARISAPGMDLSAGYDRLERRIADPIRRVPGVARVDLNGVEPREVRINLRLDRLAAHRMDLGEISDRVTNMNRNVSLGRIRADGAVTPVRGFGALADIDEIGSLPLNDRGIRVEDVADVTYREPPIPFGRHLNDETAIALTVYKSAEANTVEVATAVTELIETEIAADPALAGINLFVWDDQAAQITSGLAGIRTEGLLGALFAVILLFLFLRRVDTTSIVSLTIPMSIIATGIVLYFAGRSLNVLSMMGMMLGIGLLVDDAIVVLESIVKEHGRGIPAKTAAVSGARAVSGAVIASTVTTAVVFLPTVLGAKNEMSIWLGEIGLAISLTIFCSLFISLTLIPLVSSRILARKPSVAPRWTERLGAFYQGALRFTLRRRWITAGIAAAFLVTAILPFFLGLSTAVFAGLNRNMVFLAYEFSDFHYKEDARVAVLEVERRLAGLREELGFESVYSYFAENEAQTVISFGEQHISDAEGREMRERIREVLPVLPGARIVFGDDDQETGGDSMFFRVRLYGEDSERLAAFAREAERRLTEVEGVAELRSAGDNPRREVLVRPRTEEAARLGITPRDLAEIFGFSLGGRPLRRFQTEDREAEVLLMMSQQDISRVEDLRNFTLIADGGVPVSLGRPRRLRDRRTEPDDPAVGPEGGRHAPRRLRGRNLGRDPRPDRGGAGRDGNARRVFVVLRGPDQPAGHRPPEHGDQLPARAAADLHRDGRPVRIARPPPRHPDLDPLRALGSELDPAAHRQPLQPHGPDRDAHPDGHRGEERDRADRPREQAAPGGHGTHRGAAGRWTGPAAADPDDRRRHHAGAPADGDRADRTRRALLLPAGADGHRGARGLDGADARHPPVLLHAA